jgi:hypothetical protein
MQLPRFAFIQTAALVIVIAAASAAMGEAVLAPPNPQQERCIEAFSDTQEEKAIRAKMGEPPKEIDSIEGWDKLAAMQAWATKRAIAVYGSEKAAHAAGEKLRIAKYSRRFELLRENAKEGHLPSLYLLASHPTLSKELRGIPGLPTPRESATAYRKLYDLHFPLAARKMAEECAKAIAEQFPEPAEPTPPGPTLVDGKIQKIGTEIEILCEPYPSGPDLSGAGPSGPRPHGPCVDPEEAEAREHALEAREAEEDRREAPTTSRDHRAASDLPRPDARGRIPRRCIGLGAARAVRLDYRSESGGHRPSRRALRLARAGEAASPSNGLGGRIQRLPDAAGRSREGLHERRTAAGGVGVGGAVRADLVAETHPFR